MRIGLALFLAAACLAPHTPSLAQETTNTAAPIDPAALDALATLAQEQPDTAVQIADALLNRVRKSPDWPNHDHLYALQMRAFAQFQRGNFEQSESDLLEWVTLSEQRDDLDNAVLAQRRNSLREMRTAVANMIEESGDYAQAEGWWRRLAEQAAGAAYASDTQWRVRSLVNLGTNLKNQGRAQEAYTLLERAVILAEELGGAGSPAHQQALNDLGRAYQSNYENETAIAYFRKAADAARAANGPDDRETLASRQNLGQSLMYIERLEEAGPIIRDTLERRLAAFGPDDPHTLYSQSDLASLAMFEHRYDEARAILSDLVPRAERVLGPEHPDTAEIRALATLAETRTGGDVRRAQKLAEANAWALNDRIRYGNRAGDGTTMGATRRLIYEQHVDTARALGELDESQRSDMLITAFLSAQRAMESPASAAVARRTARAVAGNASTETLALFDQRETLAARYEALTDERTAALANDPDGQGDRLDELASEATALRLEILELDGELDEALPGLEELLNPSPVFAENATKLFEGTDDAALMILPTMRGTHLFAITAETLRWEQTDLTAPQIEAVVRRLRWDAGADVGATFEEEEEWLAEGEGKGAYPFDRQLAYVLYRQLVEPMEEFLAGKRHLYIAAGGSLSGLPFHLLVTEAPEGMDGDPDALRATRWLADRYALVQLPTLSTLESLRQAGRDPAASNGGFIGFGDPVLEGEASTRSGGRGATRSAAPRMATVWRNAGSSAGGGNTSVDPAVIRALTRLPGTASELQAMREALDAPASSIHLGEEATETAFKAAPLANAELLVLATHGLLAGEVDGAVEPGLVFTPPGDSSASTADDGLLTMSEITGLNIGADLVILSACNTAAGDGTSGATGLSGLARAFFHAGAGSLLASHWPVRDDVAARLTVRMVEIGKANPDFSRAEALQQAMREIRDDSAQDSEADTWAHPNAWAPFTLIGDASR